MYLARTGGLLSGFISTQHLSVNKSRLVAILCKCWQNLKP